MKFFKKTSVAVVLTLLIVALCCVWGYSRDAAESQPQTRSHTAEHITAGENTLNYFLRLVEDNAELFSLSTKDSLAKKNLDFATNYDSVVAIQTIDYLNGKKIDDYAEEQFHSFGDTGLSENDMLLVLSLCDEDWYLLYGSGIKEAAESDDTLYKLCKEAMREGFFDGEADDRILSLYTNLEDWYADHVTPVPQTEGNQLLQGGDKTSSVTLSGIIRGVFWTLLLNIWWILILFLVCNAIDRARYTRFRRQPPLMGAGIPVYFRPLLFWHRPGSRWFQRMEERFFRGDPGRNPFGGTSTSQRRGNGFDDFGGFGQL